VFVESRLIRMVSTPYLVQIDSARTGTHALLLSHNAAASGAWSGDSRGSSFLGDTDVVAGMTPFAINGN
jgi:hypothetical protein